MSKSSSKFQNATQYPHPHSQLQLYSPSKNNSPKIRPFRANLDLYEKSSKSQKQQSNNLVFIDNFVRRGKQFYSRNQMKKALQQFYKAQKCVKQDKKRLTSRSPIQNMLPPSNNIQQPISISLISRKIVSLHQYTNQDSIYIQICYLIGVCLLSLKNYPSSYQYFQTVQKHNKIYKRNLLMLIAIVLKNMKNYEQSIQKISQAIQIDPSIDNLLFRSQLYTKKQEFWLAINDYDSILQNNTSNINATRLKLHLLMKLGQYEKVMKHVNLSIMIIQDQNCVNQLRYAKIQTLIKLQQYNQTLQYIELLQKDFFLADSQLFYYKGIIYLKLKKANQAVIYFNQALAVNTSSKYANLSLCQLGINCFKQRDFYEAFSYLRRSQYIKDKNQLIDNLLIFAQALTLLMKRNFQQALKLLNQVKVLTFDSHESQSKFIHNIFFNTLGFSQFSLSNHKKALHQYQKITEFSDQVQQASTNYNKKLCEGIIFYNHGDQQKSIECFQKAVQHLLRPQPYFYISVILTQKSLKNQSSHQIFLKILSILQNGINIGTNSHMYFYRSLVYLYLGMDMESLQDIDKAIEISEDNVAKYFYVRGLIFLMELNYEQANSQFTTALSIHQKYSEALLQRAKCELYQQNYDSAYLDLQAYRETHSFKEQEPLWELLFMLSQKRFHDILQIEQSGLNPNNNSKIKQNIEQVHNICKFYLGKFQQCGPSGKLILALIYESFEELLKLLDEAITLCVGVGPLTPIDLKLLKGYALYKCQNYQKSIQTYEQIENTLDILQKQQFCQENQLKLLICKLNKILVTYAKQHNAQGQVQSLRQGQVKPSLQGQSIKQNETQKLTQTQLLLNQLIEEVHDGPILDQMKNFSHFLSIPNNSEQFYSLNFFEDQEMLSNFLQPQTCKNLTFRLIIPFPTLQISQIQPNRQKLLYEFCIQDVQNKPQAPWIRRGQFGIIFTNNLVELYSNLNLDTEQAANEQNNSSTNSKERLLKDLRLGSDILQKLQKMQKQKK